MDSRSGGEEPLMHLVEERTPEPLEDGARSAKTSRLYSLIKHLVLLAVSVGAGAWVSAGIEGLGLRLPAYIGAMIVAALIRNLDDWTGAIGISQRTMDDLGEVALTLFLVMALMTLRLWELAGVVVPLFVILAMQVALVAAICVWAMPRLMGRDYDAVVMPAGSADSCWGPPRMPWPTWARSSNGMALRRRPIWSFLSLARSASTSSTVC